MLIAVELEIPSIGCATISVTCSTEVKDQSAVRLGLDSLESCFFDALNVHDSTLCDL